MGTDGAASTAIILGTSALLAGTFFVNWAVDHRVIWQSPTEASVQAAVAYYHDVLDGPSWLNIVLTGVATLTVAALLLKLSKGTTSRILFDGGSLFLLSAAIFIHSQHVQGAMTTIASLPRKAESLNPSAFGAISQIASAHAIIAVTLTGVVALQGAQYYSERQIQKELRKEFGDSLPDSPALTSASQTPPRRSAPASPQKQTAGSSSLKPPEDASQNLRRSPRKRK